MHDGSPFIDFCLGPHVQHTGKLKAFKLLAISGAYWKGDAERDQMQRIYGTAFASQEELDAWLKQREEALGLNHIQVPSLVARVHSAPLTRTQQVTRSLQNLVDLYVAAGEKTYASGH